MFHEILIGVDGRSGGRAAIALATQLAAQDAVLRLAHCYVEPPQVPSPDGLGGLPRNRSARELLAEERLAARVDAKLVALADGDAGRGLHWLASVHGCDVIVIGSSHRGPLGRVFLGDHVRDVLKQPPCPVAIAPIGYRGGPLHRIGIGYDGSPESIRAAELARALGRHHGATLSALSALPLQSIPYGDWTGPGAGTPLLGEDAELLHGFELEPGFGRPDEALARFSNEVDLLIVGSRSLGRSRRLTSPSTSQRLAHAVASPLLVMPRSARSASARSQPRAVPAI